MYEGDMDHGFSGGVEEFVVFDESARPVEPGQGAFDDPSLGQHLELVQLVAFDHLHVVSEHLFGLADQLAGVTTIDEDLSDAVEAAEQAHQHGAGPHPVLDAGRTLVRWARCGYVPAHPLGEGKRRPWRFFENELLEWVETQENHNAGMEDRRTLETAIDAHAEEIV